MEEYRVECYIAADDEIEGLKDHFKDEAEYNAWRRTIEEAALNEFYNAKIKLIDV